MIYPQELLMKKTDVDHDLKSVRKNLNKENEIIDKINELRNTLLSILVEQSMLF